METSAAVKLVEVSERMKLIKAVSLALREEVSDDRAMVGLTVSTLRMSELLESFPSRLR